MATLEVPRPAEVKFLDRKLGLTPEGKLIIGATWSGMRAEGWHKPDVFRIAFSNPEVEVSGIAALDFLMPDGTWITGTHSWSSKKIAKSWDLISVPDPTKPPVLIKKVKRGQLLEEVMRKYEKGGNFDSAKAYAIEAHKAAKQDLALLAEEAAVEENRILRADSLKKMDPGDRKLFEIKGIRSFQHYADQMTGWLWYGK